MSSKLRLAIGPIAIVGLAFVVFHRASKAPPSPSTDISHPRPQDPIQTKEDKGEHAGTLLILAFDAENHMPIDAAEISAKLATESVRGVTDRTGACLLKVMDGKPCSITVAKEGYLSNTAGSKGLSRVEILLSPVPRIICTFKMENRSVKVTGKIRIGLTSGTATSFHPLKEKEVSGDSLQIDLDQVSPSSRIRLIGELQGYSMTPVELALNPNKRIYPIEVEITNSVECHGRVVDEQRAPLADTWVYVSDDPGTKLSTYTNELGQFTLYGLRPALIKLVAVQDDFETGELEVDLITTRVVELILKRRPFVIVSGRISDATGRPLAGVSINAHPGDATTDASGSFTLRLSESRASRLFDFDARKEGYVDGHFDSPEVPKQFLALKMFQAGTLTFEQGDSSPTQYKLELVNGFGAADERTVRRFKGGRDGGFTPSQRIGSTKFESKVDGLLPGLYRVTINPGLEKEKKVFAEVQPGEIATVKID